jgi:hypothetical protein
MTRKLLATTAIATLLVAGGAYAQDATQQTQQAQQDQATETEAGLQQIIVSDGDTIIIESEQANMPVNLQFELREDGAAAAGTQARVTTGADQQPAAQDQAAAQQQGTAQQDATEQQTAETGAPGQAAPAAQDQAVAEADQAAPAADGTDATPQQQQVEADAEQTLDQAMAEQTTEDTTRQQTAQQGMAAGDQQTAAAQGQTGGREHVVRDGSHIIVEAADAGDVELNVRFRTGAETAAATATPPDQTATATTDAQDETTTAAVNREGMQTQDMQQIRADDLIGSNVYGAGEENIGNVGDVILTAEGDIDAVLVDVGGFLGIGTREVAIGIDELQFMTDGDGTWHVFTPFTREQLENQPEYDEATYAEQRDQQRLQAR